MALRQPYCSKQAFVHREDEIYEAQLRPKVKAGNWLKYPTLRNSLCGGVISFVVYPTLATLYVTAQGDAVVAIGRRRWINTHWFRGNSYFRIGWEWFKAAFSKGWELISKVCFTSHHDPDPAMASRKQDEKRRYQLEFQIHTFIYATEK